MEEQVDRLVKKAWRKYQSLPPDQRLLIAIAGIPGSGKTTLATQITTGLNTIAKRDIATFVPMDGYHLTRAQLSAMPDPERAHARRGAEFTFDAPAFYALVQQLRKPVAIGKPDEQDMADDTIYAPSFDHAVKDPVAAAISISPLHRIVVLEGNYLALDKAPWSDAAKLMDEVWFLDVDFAVARRRLVKRHVAAGLAGDEEAAGRRADENDLVNGKMIVEGRGKVDEVVSSREDGEWV